MKLSFNNLIPTLKNPIKIVVIFLCESDFSLCSVQVLKNNFL